MARDNKSIQTYIPFTGTSLCVGDEQVTHLRVSISHNKKTYNTPACYVLSTTPCVKTPFGWTMCLGLGALQPFDTLIKIKAAPRFNEAELHRLYATYIPSIHKLIEDKVDSDTFRNKLITIPA